MDLSAGGRETPRKFEEVADRGAPDACPAPEETDKAVCRAREKQRDAGRRPAFGHD